MAKSLTTIENDQLDFASQQTDDNIYPANFSADSPESETDIYAGLFAGLGEDADEKVLLYRIQPGSQKQGLLCRMEPGASIEDIQPRFGGGEYVIKRLQSGRIVRNVRLIIEGESITPKPPPPIEAAERHTVSPPVDTQSIMAMMQENNRQLIAGLAQVFRQPEALSRTAMLEEMRIMQQMFAPQSSQRQIDPTEILLKGIELAKSIQPRDGETSGMDVLQEAIRSFAPAVTEVVKRAQLSPPAPLPKKVPQQLPVSGEVPLIPEAPTESEEIMLFRYYVNMLNNFAREGRDPGLYAELVADNLPESKLNEILGNPAIIDELVKINPDVENNRAWFNDLLVELRIIMGLTESPGAHNVAAMNDHPGANNAGDTEGNSAG